MSLTFTEMYSSFALISF